MFVNLSYVKLVYFYLFYRDFNITYPTHSIVVRDCAWYPFYMGFQKYVRQEWYRKSANISQI